MGRYKSRAGAIDNRDTMGGQRVEGRGLQAPETLWGQGGREVIRIKNT